MVVMGLAASGLSMAQGAGVKRDMVRKDAKAAHVLQSKDDMEQMRRGGDKKAKRMNKGHMKRKSSCRDCRWDDRRGSHKNKRSHRHRR